MNIGDRVICKNDSMREDLYHTGTVMRLIPGSEVPNNKTTNHLPKTGWVEVLVDGDKTPGNTAYHESELELITQISVLEVKSAP